VGYLSYLLGSPVSRWARVITSCNWGSEATSGKSGRLDQGSASLRSRQSGRSEREAGVSAARAGFCGSLRVRPMARPRRLQTRGRRSPTHEALCRTPTLPNKPHDVLPGQSGTHPGDLKRRMGWFCRGYDEHLAIAAANLHLAVAPRFVQHGGKLLSGLRVAVDLHGSHSTSGTAARPAARANARSSVNRGSRPARATSNTYAS